MSDKIIIVENSGSMADPDVIAMRVADMRLNYEPDTRVVITTSWDGSNVELQWEGVLRDMPDDWLQFDACSDAIATAVKTLSVRWQIPVVYTDTSPHQIDELVEFLKGLGAMEHEVVVYIPEVARDIEVSRMHKVYAGLTYRELGEPTQMHRHIYEPVPAVEAYAGGIVALANSKLRHAVVTVDKTVEVGCMEIGAALEQAGILSLCVVVDPSHILATCDSDLGSFVMAEDLLRDPTLRETRRERVVILIGSAMMSETTAKRMAASFDDCIVVMLTGRHVDLDKIQPTT